MADDEGYVEQDIGYIDVSLNVGGLHPMNATHIVGVLNRVSAGLAMEGYPVCLHIRPSEETYPATEVFVPDDEEGDSDHE